MAKRPGALMQALSTPSSFAAKRNGTWGDLMDRLTDCALPSQVDAVEEWIEQHPLEIPEAWREPLAEVIAKRRKEIEEDDIASIMRERFDF